MMFQISYHLQSCMRKPKTTASCKIPFFWGHMHSVGVGLQSKLCWQDLAPLQLPILGCFYIIYILAIYKSLTWNRGRKRILFFPTMIHKAFWYTVTERFGELHYIQDASCKTKLYTTSFFRGASDLHPVP